MKSVIFLVVFVISVGAVIGQQPVAETGSQLAVLKFSWARERVAWDDNQPMVPVSASNRPLTRKPKTEEYKKKEASEQRSIQLNASTQKEPAEDPRFNYAYEVVVRNDSAKKIREVDWDYVFLAAGTEEELGRRQFTSEEKIAEGKTKKLLIRVSTPPAYTIRANQTGKKESAAFTEKIDIVRIVYDDGTEWKAN